MPTGAAHCEARTDQCPPQSLVELKILRDLGVDSLPDWHITTERRRFPPRSQSTKGARIKAELARMQEHASKHGEVVESMHLGEDGRVLE